MPEIDSKTKKSRNWARWGMAALPLGLMLGLFVGIYFGNAAIGVAIGAALGFVGAAALFAAAVAFRSVDRPGSG